MAAPLPNTMSDIRIVGSGISVYEVEVDLGKYGAVRTDKLDGFVPKLLRMFPGMRQHECYAGEAGGFVRELKLGTDLAHVMEHLILELLKVATRSRRRFSGWTRKKGKHYVIHFQAPNGATGHCVARCALRAIQDILEGRDLSKRSLIQEIRTSVEAGQ